MINIPYDVMNPYLIILEKNNIPANITNQYIKWLRFYLNFRYKYHFSEQDSESLPHFIQKLKNKGRNSEQREQAVKAINFYYQLFYDYIDTEYFPALLKLSIFNFLLQDGREIVRSLPYHYHFLKYSHRFILKCY